MSAPFLLGPALLFCPGDRPDRVVKAVARADAVIVDLEDAVADDRKAAARRTLLETALDPERTIVRVNTREPRERDLDLAVLASAGLRWVLVGKCESVDDLLGLGAFDLIPQCETAIGVRHAPELADHPSVAALLWGAEDLVHSLGGTSSRGPDGRYRDVVRAARAAVLLAAASAGKAAVDAVLPDFRDEAMQRREAEDAAASGFAATACIHPAQVEPIRLAYAPSEDDVVRARAVLDAGRATSSGAAAAAGVMVDRPVYRQAERVLARAAR